MVGLPLDWRAMASISGSPGDGGRLAPTVSNLPELHATVSWQLTRLDHRYTRGRRRLIEILAAAARPITLREIAAGDDEMPQSSAYRNLDVLERSGVIRKIVSGGDHAYFELAEPLIEHHHHLVCVECGRMEDIHLDGELEDLVDTTLTREARSLGFSPLHHSLDLHGYCPDCQSLAEAKVD